MHKEYLTVSNIVGPLVIVEKIAEVKYNELVEIEDSQGNIRRGTVLDVSTNQAVVQVFEGTVGLDIDKSRVRFLGRSQELPVSEEIIGRVFDGSGKPRDNGPQIIARKRLDINGSPINPDARDYPSEFIQTGISSIDGMNPLVRGQKLPIFSGKRFTPSKISSSDCPSGPGSGKRRKICRGLWRHGHYL
jgi:Archaeal/vacuolar-type H+-ATPase subunit B